MLDKNDTGNSDREYVYTKLIDTLKAGHKYLASMYVNKVDNLDYAIATIGMLFTDTITTLPWPQGYIPAVPQVKHTTLIADTSQWTLIQDTITATGNEVYLTIGNFNTSATCDSVNVGGNGTYFGAAYYLIDGVSVYDLATMGIQQIKNKDVEVNVYPNPAANKVYIETKGIIESTLFDLLGKEIITTQEKEIDVSSLQQGVYFLSIKTSEGVLTKKIIVQH